MTSNTRITFSLPKTIGTPVETAETFIEKLERLKRERQAREKKEAENALIRQKEEIERIAFEKQKMLPIVEAVHKLTGGQFSQNIELNEQQQEAVRLACDFAVKEFAVYGSAGTGKTTLLRQVVVELSKLVPKFGHEHKHLESANPAIAVVSYTRRAVKNLKKALTPIGMQSLCCTIHKLLEYAPEKYTDTNDEGELVEKMHFVPTRTKDYKLEGLKFIIVDEAGMESVPLAEEVYAAAPYGCRFLFLGDIYQLPPVYGSAILGYKLADAAAGLIPHVELSKVYRQALDSPILRYALQVKEGKCPEFAQYLCNKQRTWASPTGDSKLHVMPISETSDSPDFLNAKFGDLFRKSYMEGRFDPDNDVVLIPHGKPHTFGSYQLSLHIAQAIADKNNLDVHEVYSGFNKLYLCIGDRVAVGSQDGKIISIVKNGKYFGKFPRPATPNIDRWGRTKLGKMDIDPSKVCLDGKAPGAGTFSLDAIDAFLDQGRVEDRKAQASHIVTIQLEDSTEEVEFATAAELNLLTFTYALTCHKAQGAEWRKVYIILHHVHAGMYSREWLYTAMTRAREECFILARPAALDKCVKRAVIHGVTLAEKAEYFKGKQEERETRKLFTTATATAEDEA